MERGRGDSGSAATPLSTDFLSLKVCAEGNQWIREPWLPGGIISSFQEILSEDGADLHGLGKYFFNAIGLVVSDQRAFAYFLCLPSSLKKVAEGRMMCKNSSSWSVRDSFSCQLCMYTATADRSFATLRMTKEACLVPSV